MRLVRMLQSGSGSLLLLFLSTSFLSSSTVLATPAPATSHDAEQQSHQMPLGINDTLLKDQTAYGFWDSPITPATVSGGFGNPLENVFVDQLTGEVYYSEVGTREGGRGIVRRLKTGEAVFGKAYNARTRVHEYGGGHAAAYNGTVYFSNKDDRVYEVRSGEEPRAITPLDPTRRYAEFAFHPVYPRFIAAVEEDHHLRGRINNRPTLLDSETSVVKARFNFDDILDEHKFEGRRRIPPPDFWDSMSFSPDGKQLIARAWYHPYMSWEASQLYLLDIAVGEDVDRPGDITLVASHPRPIAGDREKVAVGDPHWLNTTALVFTSDESGYFNPWIYSLETGKARPVLSHPLKEDFGEATWWLGLTNNAVLNDNHILSAAFRQGRSQLYVSRISDGAIQALNTPFSYIQYLKRVADGRAVFIGRTDTHSPSIVRVTVEPRPDLMPDLGFEVFYEAELLSSENANPPSVPTSYISIGSPYVLEHPQTGEPIHAIYYPPTNPEYSGGLPGELPPVVVNVHGGPTHETYQGLSWMTQLFTTRGFAWLDVNYGGSMTYGRAYRERLLGKWGIVDVDDSVIAVKQLGARGLLDPSRALIRGGSAGGFTTFAALATRPEAFAAGTSMFGVSDLRTLQKVMHKLESHYLLKYVGGTPETDPERWWERSPISKADQVRSPLLILQGEVDPVVPVDQATTMYETIKRMGVPTELRVFKGEGHGWRMANTTREALELEIAWYQKVLNGTIHAP